MTLPKVGQKFKHKLIDNHPECSVVSIDEPFVLYSTPGDKIHAVYISEFPSITMKDTPNADQPEDSGVQPANKPRPKGGGRVGSRTPRNEPRQVASGTHQAR